MKVFLNEYIHPEARALLERHAQITDAPEDAAEVEAAIVRTTPIRQAFLDRTPRLRVVGKHGIGYDNIDMTAVKARGITAVYTPLANVNSVAELIVGQFLSLARKLQAACDGVRDSRFAQIAPPELTGTELTGKTVGLVGLGHVARQAAQILGGGFQCRLMGYDPFVDAEQAADLGIQKAETLEELLRQADLVSVSVPLNDATRGMIGAEQLGWLRPGALLVNTARGGIVDEEALFQALTGDKLAGAASDVFAQEPPTAETPLAALPNFLPTPHIGANTEEALYRMGMTVVQDVLTALSGGWPQFPIP